MSPVTALQQDILTVAEVAELLRCKPSSIYNLTRRRGRVRYAHEFPVIRAPFGLRFRRSDVMAWLDKMAGSHA
jgi:predicted DNA-binding transcriptional regulator AlpA